LKTSLVLKIAGIILAASAVAGGGIALAAQTGSPTGDAPSATPTTHKGQGDDCEGNASTSPDSSESARPSSTDQHGDDDAVEPTASGTGAPEADEANDNEGTEQSEGCGRNAAGATSTSHDGAEEPEAHTSATNMQHSPEPTGSGGRD
jgi:hypothetical protein